MSNPLPINWFDILVLIVLLIGYSQGRKNGMSKEMLTVIKWVAVVLVSAIVYQPLGLFINSLVGVGQLWSYVIAYTLTAVVVILGFALIKNAIGDKFSTSDAFGKGEFYLGMPAGMLRFGCILLALLALLNARLYRTEEIKAMAKFQNDNYGSQFFPTLSSVQSDVFEESFLGPQIKKYGSFLLIEPTPTGKAKKTSSGPRRREFTLP